MAQFLTRLTRLAHSPRATFILFMTLIASTVVAILIPQLARSGSTKQPLPTLPLTSTNHDPHGVQLAATLLQSKFIQGDNGTVYLDLTLTAPALSSPSTAYRPSDIIVVLDRSGSMAAENKLPYAKEAVRSVVERLRQDDRFALVTFDTRATVSFPLTQVTGAVREQLAGQLQRMQPGDSTNISDGLLKAQGLFKSNPGERSRRVILLSDGEANQGIIDPKGLEKIAASFGQHGAVLSTIGMGLGFNETLMASLADYGMGHYAYLEHLAALGDILQKDLQEAQQVYASASGLAITLGEGVSIVDASGYPLDMTSQPGTVRIVTGQLLSGSQKRLVITMQVPTAQLGNVPLGTVTLHYTANNNDSSITLPSDTLRVAILEPARRDEAVASIDQELYRQVWQGHNFGRMQKNFSQWLRSGDKKKAEEALATYRDELQQAETASGIPLQSPATSEKLSTMEQDMHEAFTGSASQQEAKRNRAAKDQHLKALQKQRSY